MDVRASLFNLSNGRATNTVGSMAMLKDLHGLFDNIDGKSPVKLFSK